MTEERYTLQERIKDAKQEAIDRLNDEPDMVYPDDMVHEIADGSVPVYTSDILDMVQDDYNLAIVEPELGPAFSGESTPVNIIAANIYEQIYRAVAEAVNQWREEREE